MYCLYLWWRLLACRLFRPQFNMVSSSAGSCWWWLIITEESRKSNVKVWFCFSFLPSFFLSVFFLSFFFLHQESASVLGNSISQGILSDLALNQIICSWTVITTFFSPLDWNSHRVLVQEDHNHPDQCHCDIHPLFYATLWLYWHDWQMKLLYS